MKRLFLFLLLIMCTMSFAQKKSFYDFTVKTIDGKDFPLSSLKGKKVLVVNVASKCGLTPQYEHLQDLYEKYGPDKFVIIAFPANNFAKQEPGTNEEIREFCKLKYGVTFPMMEKISVKGDDMAPVYKWLTTESENGKKNVEVTWNFQKFLINEKGEWDGFAEPKTSPLDKTITAWIEAEKVR